MIDFKCMFTGLVSFKTPINKCVCSFMICEYYFVDGKGRIRCQLKLDKVIHKKYTFCNIL